MAESELSLSAEAGAARTGRRLKPALGYLLAAAGLVWVCRDLRPGELFGQLAQITWWQVALALGCDVLAYYCQGWRWRLLLRPVGEVPALRSTQAIYAGLFTNEILPMRMGELVRAYLVSRWTGAKLRAVIPSMIVERFFDGVWLAAGIGLTALSVPLPGDLLRAGQLLGVAMVVATGLGLSLLLFVRSSGGWLGRVRAALGGVGRKREFYLSFGLSLAFLVLEILAFWLIMLGYGLALSFWVGAAVLLIVHLGTAIPNAPANLGSYQFFCVVGLTLFGVDPALATGFSLVVFVLLTLPLLAIGYLAFSRSGATLLAIRREMGGSS